MADCTGFLFVLETHQLEDDLLYPPEQLPPTRFDPIQDLQVERLPVKLSAVTEVGAHTITGLGQGRGESNLTDRP